LFAVWRSVRASHQPADAGAVAIVHYCSASASLCADSSGVRVLAVCTWACSLKSYVCATVAACGSSHHLCSLTVAPVTFSVSRDRSATQSTLHCCLNNTANQPIVHHYEGNARSAAVNLVC
jgi:hypothetical protein